MNRFDLLRSKVAVEFKDSKDRQTIAQRGIEHAEKWAQMKNVSDFENLGDSKETLKKECAAYIKEQLKKDYKEGLSSGFIISILGSIAFQIIATIIVKWIISILFS